MLQETLFAFKKEIAKLMPVVKGYATATDNDEIIISIYVLLQNACFRWEDCHGYTLEEDNKKVENIYNFFVELRKYEVNNHFVKYVCNEFIMAYDGYNMTEFIESHE